MWKKLVFLDLTYPEEAEFVMSKFNTASDSTPYTLEMRHKVDDGKCLWVLAAVVRQEQRELAMQAGMDVCVAEPFRIRVGATD